MIEKSLPEVIEGIKDCLLAGFAAQMSKIPPGADGWTLGQYLEVLAHHLSPVIARFLMSVGYAELDKMLKELKASHEEQKSAMDRHEFEIAALREQIAQLSGADIPGTRAGFWKRKG